MKLRIMFFALALIAGVLRTDETKACTGLSLRAKDGSCVFARTCEWGTDNLNSRYVIVPRGYKQKAFTPTGENGMVLEAKYGYVGVSVKLDQFVNEGLNEAGLSAGLFFFPGYGGYEKYDSALNSSTLIDMQLVPWILCNFATVDEVIAAIDDIHIVSLPGVETAHWNISDKTGRQVVLEITGGKPHFYENKVGVLTNSPGFEWHLLNLNNYVNLYPGNAAPQQLTDEMLLKSFGAGTGFRGIPGDVTPPSRFVRIAFYRATAPQYATGYETVKQCFQILNNFDIPIGIEYADAGAAPADLVSATQWTTAADFKAMKFYYRTAWNSTLRCIDLSAIDFAKVPFQSALLDKHLDQPVEYIKVARKTSDK